MPIDTGKYVTFKRLELIKALADGKDPLTLELHDAVVIRKKDVFAPAGLSAYANACVTVAETIELYGDTTLAKTLMEIADYFASQADESRRMLSRLPD
jgi:hypothetical protein